MTIENLKSNCNIIIFGIFSIIVINDSAVLRCAE